MLGQSCRAEPIVKMKANEFPTLSTALPDALAIGRNLAKVAKANPAWSLGAAIAVALGAAAVVNRRATRKAEKDNPPTGNFVSIDGCQVHYIEQGAGDAVILLHGNGSMLQDFTSSGLLALAAPRYRVVAFDRPGYGHSDRPRSTIWTADAQADLVRKVLSRLNIERAIVLGHSWGASVAVALALRHPDVVRGLVLASGYYYPTPRADVVLLSGPAVPIIGDVMRWTIAPLLSRIMWPLLLRKIFGPRPVPAKFSAFPKELAVRPSQIRASAAEAALMVPGAIAHAAEYPSLKMPVTIIAGTEDQLIDSTTQSLRLHNDIAQSKYHCLPGEGHMIHQTATSSLLNAIDSTSVSCVRREGKAPAD